jgi:PAS domain S-box-containing protein
MPSSPSPSPHRPPALSLVGERAALWLFVSGACAIGLVWASEASFGVLAPNDRIAYPLLLACFLGGALVAWKRPRWTPLAQRIGALAIQAYVLATAWVMLAPGRHDGGLYALATLAPWAVAAQLVLFAVWPPGIALTLAVATTVLAPLPLLWMADPAHAAWRGEAAALLVNALLAGGLSAAMLYGLARQLQRLIGLADAEAPLTIDDLVRRRHDERQRARQADDHASRASQALASREAEMQAVLEAFPGMVAWTDEAGIYQFANRNFTALYDLEPAQVVGRSLAEIIGPERATETLQRRAQLAAAGRPITFERHMTHPLTGAPVDLLVTHFVMPPRAPGDTRRFCQLAMDIGDRKRAEAALVAARDLAERANRAKSEFLSRMSHELRTPMNAVLGFSQLLEMDGSLEARHQLHVREILRAGRHLLALIDEVLDLARVEAGRIELAPAQIRLAAQVDECLALVGPLAQARSIALVAEVPPDAQVEADPTRLRQVLINLLSNAIKYNRDIGDVRVVAAPIAGGWRVDVVDTGPGIPAELQGQLFEPFNRLGAEHGGVQGAGIGLVITRRLVEAMGGRIGLESRPGEGCRFWFELPSAVPDDPAAAV